MGLQNCLKMLEAIEQGLNQNGMMRDFRHSLAEVPTAYLQEFDDTGWIPTDGSFPFDKSSDILWGRYKIQVPSDFMGIAVEGMTLRLMAVFQAPLKVYCKGRLVLQERHGAISAARRLSSPGMPAAGRYTKLPCA